MDTEQYLLTCMRYIELNPVRAGMVEDAASYPWSSFRANALGGEDFVVSPHAEYKRLGRSGGERAQAYRALFEQQIGRTKLDEIREATSKAWVLGNDRFREEVARKLSRRVSPAPRGGDRRSAEYRRKRCFDRV